MADLVEAAAVAGGAIYGWLSSSSTAFLQFSCRPLSVRMNLAKRGVAVRLNRLAPLLDLDSSSRPSFKARKGLKRNRFLKNERPKRLAEPPNRAFAALIK